MKNNLFTLVCVVALLGCTYSQGIGSRIVNGEAVELKSYHAYVESFGTNGTVGSGSFITRRHVLTSSTLIRGFVQWLIGYGSVDFANLINVTSNIALIHNNVGLQFWPNRNDVGIILLDNEITSGLVEPIALPTSAIPLPRDNEEGSVVSFTFSNTTGRPDVNSVLHGAYLQTIMRTRCSSTHISGDLQNAFCASDPYYNSNTCSGSVGSGFVVRSRGVDLLAGVLTTFNPLCRISDVSTYVEVRFYLPWIRAIIGDDIQ